MKDPTYPPDVQTVILPAGTLRRLYVNRTNARNLEPPIMVEDTTTGVRHYGANVKAHTGPDPIGGSPFEFCWSRNNVDAPALWIETKCELEVILR